MSTDHDFSDLSAVFLSCTLKPSPEPSNTEALMANSIAIMAAHGVRTDLIRAVNHDIAPGVQPDMTAHGFARDDWPALGEKVLAAAFWCWAPPSGWARNPASAPG